MFLPLCIHIGYETIAPCWAALVEFDSGVTLVQDFTNDPNRMAKQIKTLRAAGGTALYDAIYLTCDEKLIREMGRKALVILSDGEDQSSTRTLEEALAIRESLDGNDGEKTLDVRAALGELLLRKGRLEDAERKSLEFVSGRVKVSGEFHPKTAAART